MDDGQQYRLSRCQYPATPGVTLRHSLALSDVLQGNKMESRWQTQTSSDDGDNWTEELQTEKQLCLCLSGY